MSSRSSGRGPRSRPPLDGAALEALAIHYVGRYATTCAKLARYLDRKVRERGWAEDGGAPIERVVARCAALGYVDDAAFAAARGAALGRRGFGERRVAQDLHAAGVAEEEAAPVRTHARDGALEAALAFARRKRIGPFAREPRDPDQQRRDVAALLRAGHDLALARRIAASPPGNDVSR